jgi:hypothetical protein
VARAEEPRTKELHLSPAVTTALLVVALIIVLPWPSVVVTVPSGSVGVYWKRILGFDFYCRCFVGRGTILDPAN